MLKDLKLNCRGNQSYSPIGKCRFCRYAKEHGCVDIKKSQRGVTETAGKHKKKTEQKAASISLP